MIRPVTMSIVLMIDADSDGQAAQKGREVANRIVGMEERHQALCARVEVLERALRGMLDNLGCGCCAPNGYCDAIDAARAAIAKAEGGGK